MTMRHRMAAALLIGMLLAPAAPAATQVVAPHEAPAEWLRYAEAATATITGWLGDDSESAQRMRAYLDATRPAPGQPTPPLVLKLWIDRAGKVERIDYAAFVHAEANTDLMSLIVGRSLGSPPPRGMLVPMHIVISLD